MGRAGVRQRLILTVVSHPGCALAGQLGAVANQSPELLQEAGAVGPQLLGYELAWQLRHRRKLSSLARVQNLPTSLWKLWKTRLWNRSRAD